MAHERAKPRDAAAAGSTRRPLYRQTFSSLRNRDYRFLFVGNAFNFMAYWLQIVSLGWLVWELTKDPITGQGSPLLSSTAAGLRAVPTLVVGPWSGVYLDRIDRRKMVIAVQFCLAVSATLFAFLVASGEVEVWHAFVYAGVSSVFHSIMQPGRQALIANVVPEEDLQNAIALQAMAVTGNRIVGAMTGGLLITTVGIKWNFFVEAFAYLCMGTLLLPMRTPYRQKVTTLGKSVLANLRDGLRYIWMENRVILYLTLMFLLLSSVFLPIPALLPAYTGEVLGSEADVGAYLMGALGAGGFTATFVIASFGFFTNKGKMGLIVLIIGSAAVLVFAQSHWLVLAMAMLVILGFFQTHFMVSNQTLVQTLTTDEYRGRVISIYTVVIGLESLAIFLIGLFMELYGASAALTGVAAISLGVAVCYYFTFKQVRVLP